MPNALEYPVRFSHIIVRIALPRAFFAHYSANCTYVIDVICRRAWKIQDGRHRDVIMTSQRDSPEVGDIFYDRERTHLVARRQIFRFERARGSEKSARGEGLKKAREGLKKARGSENLGIVCLHFGSVTMI